jgi:hypothetical protein
MAVMTNGQSGIQQTLHLLPFISASLNDDTGSFNFLDRLTVAL